HTRFSRDWSSDVCSSDLLSQNFWMSSGNTVSENVVEGSGRADIALAGPASSGNCFADNEVSFTLPVGLEVFQSCSGFRLPSLFEIGRASCRQRSKSLGAA